jgi:hypothetical protein
MTYLAGSHVLRSWLGLRLKFVIIFLIIPNKFPHPLRDISPAGTTSLTRDIPMKATPSLAKSSYYYGIIPGGHP